MVPKKLPIFKGYTVDVRLKQFRKIKKECIKFVDFDSVKGERLFSEYVGGLSTKSKGSKS